MCEDSKAAIAARVPLAQVLSNAVEAYMSRLTFEKVLSVGVVSVRSKTADAVKASLEVYLDHIAHDMGEVSVSLEGGVNPDDRMLELIGWSSSGVRFKLLLPL